MLLISLRSKFVLKKHNKIIYLLSFPGTSSFIIEKLYEKYEEKLVICYTKNAKVLANEYAEYGCKIYSLDSIYELIVYIIPYLKGSKLILCDNYFAQLGGISFAETTKIVQLWHANGAIKKFGLEANYTKNTNEADKRRYQRVYSKFTHYIVSSKHMAQIFADSYCVSPVILPFGYPLTDIYFNKEKSKILLKKREIFKEKKILLYAPTYRDFKSRNPMDFDELDRTLGEEWKIIVHPHPHDVELLANIKKDANVTSTFDDFTFQELLMVTDVLVTDYSSIPFEYSLANRLGKVIFFCYDFDRYEEEVGLQSEFKAWASELIVTDFDGLLKKIQDDQPAMLDSFNREWNEFVSGNSIKQLEEWIDEIYDN